MEDVTVGVPDGRRRPRGGRRRSYPLGGAGSEATAADRGDDALLLRRLVDQLLACCSSRLASTSRPRATSLAIRAETAVHLERLRAQEGRRRASPRPAVILAACLVASATSFASFSRSFVVQYFGALCSLPSLSKTTGGGVTRPERRRPSSSSSSHRRRARPDGRGAGRTGAGRPARDTTGAGATTAGGLDRDRGGLDRRSGLDDGGLVGQSGRGEGHGADCGDAGEGDRHREPAEGSEVVLMSSSLLDLPGPGGSR